MDAESYRNNWQSLSGKLRAQYSDLTDEDLKRAETSESDLLDVMKSKYGLDPDQTRMYLTETIAYSTEATAPTLDPPKTTDPQEHTAPPQ